MKKLNEKQRIIQEQANLIMKNKRRVALMHQVLKIRQFSWLQKSSKKVEKERRDNPDGLIAKDKEILAAAEKLAKKE